MAGKLIHIFKGFLGFLFPQKCLGCARPNVILCDKCLALFPDPPFEKTKAILAATSYHDEVVKKAIRFLKYHGIKILAEPLAKLMLKRMDKTIIQTAKKPEETIIIPIPLSKKRHRQRGYNQTELIGQFLSDKLSIKMENNVLYKIKDTGSQVEIKDRDKRLQNIIGAFAVKNPEIIKDKKIILIDDISTTGATLNEAKKVLKAVGAKKVIGWVVAR